MFYFTHYEWISIKQLFVSTQIISRLGKTLLVDATHTLCDNPACAHARTMRLVGNQFLIIDPATVNERHNIWVETDKSGKGALDLAGVCGGGQGGAARSIGRWLESHYRSRVGRRGLSEWASQVERPSEPHTISKAVEGAPRGGEQSSRGSPRHSVAASHYVSTINDSELNV